MARGLPALDQTHGTASRTVWLAPGDAHGAVARRTRAERPSLVCERPVGPAHLPQSAARAASLWFIYHWPPRPPRCGQSRHLASQAPPPDPHTEWQPWLSFALPVKEIVPPAHIYCSAWATAMGAAPGSRVCGGAGGRRKRDQSGLAATIDPARRLCGREVRHARAARADGPAGASPARAAGEPLAGSTRCSGLAAHLSTGPASAITGGTEPVLLGSPGIPGPPGLDSRRC